MSEGFRKIDGFLRGEKGRSLILSYDRGCKRYELIATVPKEIKGIQEVLGIDGRGDLGECVRNAELAFSYKSARGDYEFNTNILIEREKMLLAQGIVVPSISLDNLSGFLSKFNYIEIPKDRENIKVFCDCLDGENIGVTLSFSHYINWHDRKADIVSFTDKGVLGGLDALNKCKLDERFFEDALLGRSVRTGVTNYSINRKK